VAGGVFAQQGEWSLNGYAEVGTRLDFDPDPEQDRADDPARVNGITFMPWDAMYGKLSLGYTRGPANIGLDFGTSGTGGSLAFSGDNFQAKAAVGGLVDSWQWNVDKLWGEYGFVNGIVTLRAAYKSNDDKWWVSDVTGTTKDVIGYWGADKVGAAATGGAWAGGSDNLTYLLTNIGLGALEFGVLLPNLFEPSETWANPIPAGDRTKLVDGVLKQMIFGVKFAQSPFEFAAQFNLANYGVYFGGRFFAGPITVGVSAEGILDGDGKEENNNADPQLLKFGGRVEYSGSGFGGGIAAFYEKKDKGIGESPAIDSDWYLSTVGIEPFFFFDAIPSHLRFDLDVGFYFLNDTDGSTKNKATVWVLEPKLYWNFLGTGAPNGYGWGAGTGILVRYRMANSDTRELPNFGGQKNNSVNFLDVAFTWSF